MARVGSDGQLIMLQLAWTSVVDVGEALHCVLHGLDSKLGVVATSAAINGVRCYDAVASGFRDAMLCVVATMLQSTGIDATT